MEMKILPIEPSAEAAWLMGTLNSYTRKEDVRKINLGKDAEDDGGRNGSSEDARTEIL